jgi:transcriptional regulator with XRE-family HTH domain
MHEDESSPIGTAHVRAMAEEAAADPEYQAALARLEFSEGIARELIRLRMQLKLTQAALARRVGTTPSVISRLERGDHEPSTATLRKVAEATGTRLLISFAPRRRGHSRPRRTELELRPDAGLVGALSRRPTEAIRTRR